VSQSDEFAAGFADDDSTVDGGQNSVEEELRSNDNTPVGDTDLANDVSGNLGILSSLFSDIEGVKPAMEVPPTLMEKGNKKSQTSSSAWLWKRWDDDIAVRSERCHHAAI
jgi:hypothetical protein